MALFVIESNAHSGAGALLVDEWTMIVSGPVTEAGINAVMSTDAYAGLALLQGVAVHGADIGTMRDLIGSESPDPDDGVPR